ncbi:MBL fold metallo-hydrolase [Rickettsiales endosymbiont of Peranema trichophorum]|uniref:MBL fold metallo-hydrolase n=1 Tax=Rickettsiales endosymbiont of Peranema trichophorum TaxID=2486577 RepID=UPI001A913772|nr:MBL fold metallo-hydrolase [Rickettsiales endosymbiont of Peranema trichophorum]
MESKNTKILVDTTPDLRFQALKHNIKYVDAILYTHPHADHIMGIDDVKLLSKNDRPIPCYGEPTCLATLEQQFPYNIKQLNPLYPPKIKPVPISPYQFFTIQDVDVYPFLQEHGGINSLGFRVGSVAYSTDLVKLPQRSVESLKNLDIWILDCLRYSVSPSHIPLELVLHWTQVLSPKLTVLTHMSHSIEYEEIKKMLPSNIVPAYDGMILSNLTVTESS